MFAPTEAVGTELPDGTYTKGQIHAPSGKYAELCAFMPLHDPYFKAVVVKDGLVIGHIVEGEDAPAPKPAKPAEPAAASVEATAKPKKPIVFS